MKKFLLTILSLVALVATGYTTESRAATADALAVVTTPAEGDAVEQFTEMLVTFNKPVYDQSKTASLYNADGTLVITKLDEKK
jgi:methionine-rich copper-binding protein CopC